jgi:hypothetical protein
MLKHFRDPMLCEELPVGGTPGAGVQPDPQDVAGAKRYGALRYAFLERVIVDWRADHSFALTERPAAVTVERDLD